MHVKNIQTIVIRPGLLLGLFLVVLISVSVCVAVASAHGVNRAWVLATTHQSERYTALYFSNPAQLPLYAPAEKAEVVPFHITNHEGATKFYQYQIRFTVNGAEITRSGSLTLMDGQDEQIFANFTMPKPNEQGQLTIQLVGTTERLTLRSQS